MMLDPKRDPNAAKAEPDKKQLKTTYARLPEENKQQILDKANAAMVVDQQDDALRLLEKVKKVALGDYDAALMGVRIFRATGDLEKARDYVAAHLAAKPNDPKLQLLNKKVQD